LQAEALGLPHHILPVNTPFEKTYEAGLRWLQNHVGIDCVFTGDIAEINGCPNWIRERSRVVGIDVYTPLWGRDRNVLLQQLVDQGFKAYVSFVQTSKLDEKWVGRELDSHAISELNIISADNGLDLCGENGEYHTLVADGPLFTGPIAIPPYSIRTAGSVAYMELQQMEIVSDVAV
jgi:uncharacterized protein (TIGR00290 family)